jgi:hypothetical protein
LQISHQTTTSVVSNFMDIGIVKIVGKRQIQKNVYSTLQIVTDYKEQSQVAQKRLEEKYQIWLRQGKNMYHLVISTELLLGIENEIK